MTFHLPELHTMGAHQTQAGLISKALRVATRPTPGLWTRQPLDLDSAIVAISSWALDIDLDCVDAFCAVPGHDGTSGPGHTLGVVLAATTGIPLIDACRRTVATTSACLHGRHHWTHHASTMRTPSRHRPRRLALVDNTIATGNTAFGAINVLHSAGHSVTRVIAASHTAQTNQHRSGLQ